MEDRLKICFEHLKEVEAKLLEQLQAPTTEFKEAARISEALSFLSQAIRAISQTREVVEGLPESVKCLEPVPARSKTAGAS